MDLVLILDTETTGLDPKKDRVIEVGAILYSVKHASPIMSFAAILPSRTNEAEAITRSPAELLQDYVATESPWEVVGRMEAEAILAHNAEFDRAFVPAELRDQPWICTKNDVTWPKQTKLGGSLVNLALEHGLGVAYAHRALADCELISRLLMRAAELGADVSALLERALRPKGTFMALVPFERKDEAKAAGFSWDAANKVWHRRMFVDDIDALPFQVRPISI